MNKQILVFLPLVILLVLGGLLINRLGDPRQPGSIDSPLIGKPLPDLGIDNLPDGPFVINFFASWCTPCLVEHPNLMQMKQDGITIIGIVFKDTQDNIDAFIKKHGAPYSRIILDGTDDIAISMGITGVPESFAVDADGIIRAREQGPLADERRTAAFLEGLK